MKIVGWNPGEVTAEIEKTAMDRLEKAGEVVAASARAKVPVLTGKLKDTIRVTRLKGDPKQDVWVIAGNRVEGGSMKKGAERGAFYSHMVEFGTIKMRPRPFMRPAINGAKEAIMGIMENG